MSIPSIMGDPRYLDHLRHREQMFNERATEAFDAFKTCDAVVVNKPGGAFYFTVMFKDGVLNDQQMLPIESREVRERVEQLVKGVPPDKRFVYYLMGATGIVGRPKSGYRNSFSATRKGLRTPGSARS